MSESKAGSRPLKWKLLTKKRPSSTQGIPPGKEALAWVTNTVTLIYGERDAVLVDTFLSAEHSKEEYGIHGENPPIRETSGIKHLAIMHDDGVNTFGFKGHPDILLEWMIENGFTLRNVNLALYD
jgi:hypothetical protein